MSQAPQMADPRISREESQPDGPPGRSRGFSWLGIIGLACVVITLTLLFSGSPYPFLMFHTLAELVAVAVAWGVFMLVWNARRFIRNEALVILSGAYAWVGLIHLLHALTFHDMKPILGHEGADLATQLWVGARYIETGGWLLFALTLGRRVSSRLFLLGLSAAALLLLAAMLHWDAFPACWREGQGPTPFKIASEAAVCVGLLVAGVIMTRRSQELARGLFQGFRLALGASILSELFFLAYSNVDGMASVIGHVIKAISFGLLYFALIRLGLSQPYATLFYNYRRRSAELKMLSEQWRRFLDHMTVPMVILDEDGLIREQNPAAGRLGFAKTGSQHADSVWDLATREGRGAVHERIRAVVSTGRPQSFREQYVDSEGRRMAIESVLFRLGKNGGGKQQLGLVGMDISDRLARESEYASFVEAALDGFWLIDGQGNILDANQAASTMLGYPLHELVGKHISDIDAVETPEDTRGHLQEMVDKGYLRFETRHRRKDGRVIDVEIGVTFLGAGYERGMAFIRDISERRLNQTLLEARVKLEDLSHDRDLAGLMQAILDEVEVLTDSSIGFFHFADEDEQNLTLQAWSSNTVETMCTALVTERHYPVRTAGVWADALRQHKSLIHNDFESVVGKKGMPEGHAPVTRQLTVPIFRRGRIVALMGVGNKEAPYHEGDLGLVEKLADLAWDLVENKIIEERFKLAFATSPDGIAITSFPDGVFVDANPRFQELVGMDLEALSGMDAADLPLWRGGEGRRALVGQLVRTGKARNLELQLPDADGKLQFLLLSSNLVQMEGKDHVVSILRDITSVREAEEERLLLEAQLNHARKLETVGRLAGGIAHDFNNLLTVITGCVEMMQLDAGPDHPMAREIGMISQTAAKAAALTRQLLTYSRKQPGCSVLMRPSEMLRSNHALLGRMLGEEIDLRCETPADLPPVLADPSQFEQVIFNLLVNARDAMPHGGTISLKVERVQEEGVVCRGCGKRFGGDFIVTGITDSGPGIPPENLDRIFEPFFTTKDVGRGTGLGLATAVGILDACGGHITVKSEVGRGATFLVYLPVAGPETQAEAEERREPATLKGRESVLVVEDDAQVGQITSTILERNGYRVNLAEGPLAALELLSAEGCSPDLVLSDVVMPDMSGQDLMLAARTRGHRAPFLFMSGYPQDILDGRDLLTVDQPYLKKPFSPEGLLTAVRGILDSADRT
ncbi:MAG: MASE3 domain-containing protein [bacterium]